jgi:pyruvate dehydrogenase E1 component
VPEHAITPSAAPAAPADARAPSAAPAAPADARTPSAAPAAPADARTPSAAPAAPADARTLAVLRAIERKVLWLASWTIHNANHLRPNPDGLKVGGHQASSASLCTLMTALYMHVLRPEDRVAVKPHASPVFHAIQYLLGNQSREMLERFRAFGGAQSYPSRTKDVDDVDFSTGSVGLGVAMTAFAGLVRDYVAARDWLPGDLGRGRMVALVGDAELDEGNVFEALLEGWKHEFRNVWWVVDYNRQSLDAVVTDRLFGRIDRLFSNMGWRVVTLKYGKLLQAAFARPGGEVLREWIDDCPNSLYSALVYKGGAAWRKHLAEAIGSKPGIRAILDDHDDEALAALMTNLGGQDMETVLEAFHGIDDDTPTCFIAYTIKGFGLPLAGHKDNHSGLMSLEQMERLRATHAVPEGREWDRFAGLDQPEAELESFLAQVPFAARRGRRYHAARIEPPARIETPRAERLSTQDAFGRILAALARDRGELGRRIVTTSPDVTVSTNLGGWVNRRGVFDRHPREDVFSQEKVASFQRWAASPMGQHIELGIAENNLFILLAALGLSHSLFGERLLPIGTLYDPFIERGLDALNYACYQDARFMLVATPSGISLAPEGGAHQSVGTPMIGMAQDGLTSFEPAFADELAAIFGWSLDYLQRNGTAGPDDLLADARGGSVYLRLSTRAMTQPEREADAGFSREVIAGGYWLKAPAPGARFAIAYTGAIAPEALAAHAALAEDVPEAGLLAITSADRLFHGWQAAERARQAGRRETRAHLEDLLAPLARDAHLVSVIDGHPATLAWLGSVRGQRQRALGVERFGQSGTVADLYRLHGIDTDAILSACAAAWIEASR